MRRTEADKPKKSESGHLAKASTKVRRLERVDNEEKRVFNMARKKIIAGNWKMNMTPSQAVALVNELKPLVETGYGGCKGQQHRNRSRKYVL